MRLLRIRLTNYRGIGSIEHKLGRNGVTILEGPNECGKSCVLEAFDHLLEDLDSSKSQGIRDLTPSGRDVGTEVEADIETGPYFLTCRKQWNKNPETELRIAKPRVETLVGRPAHERLEEILKDTLDVDLFKALRITQGTGFDTPSLPADSSLTRALDKAAGGASVSEREVDLLSRAEEEASRYWTETGRPKEVVREANNHLESVRKEEARVASSLGQADAETSQFENMALSISELNSKRSDLERDAQTWEARKAEVEGQQEVARVAEAQSDAARAAWQTAKLAQDNRAQLESDVDRLRREHLDLVEQARAAGISLEEVRRAADKARKRAEAAEKSAETATALAQLRKNDSEAFHSAFDLTLLEERRAKAALALERRDRARELLASNAVTDAVLAELRNAQQEVAIAQARLSDASPTLKITAKKKLEGELDGGPIKLEPGEIRELRVPNSAHLKTALVDLSVRAGTSLDELTEKHSQAEGALRKRLAGYALSDVDDATAANRTRQEAERDKKAAEGELKDALRIDKPLAFKDIQELEAKILEVKGRVTALRAGRPKTPAAPRTREEAATLSAQAETEAQSAVREAKKARVASDAAITASSQASELHAAKKARADQAAAQHKTISDRLTKERQAVPDEELARATEARSKDFETAKATLNAARTKVAHSDPETVFARAKSARSAVDRIDRELRELEDQRTALGGRIQVYAQQGLHEARQRCQADIEAAQAEATSINRRAEAARLLVSTLRRYRAEAQRRYVGPLQDQLVRLGRYVYGGTFDVQVNDSLEVTDRSLYGITLPYRALSKGAKEQLSLLMRLACSLIVSKDGEGVPLFIDDALGYTDPERLSAMGAVLDRVGQEGQIVLLTSTPDRYQSVGSATVLRLPSTAG